MRPSNSPTRPCSSHAKSVRATSRPVPPRTSTCSDEGRTPQRCSTTRLRISPTLSLRPSAKSTARAARRLPGVPARSKSRVADRRRGAAGPRRRAASRATTAASCGSDRARSRAVRTTDGDRTPSTSSISSSRSRATWHCRTRPAVVRRGRAAGDVHPVERRRPTAAARAARPPTGGSPPHGRRRPATVACDEQPVPGGGIGGQEGVDVGPAPQPRQLARRARAAPARRRSSRGSRRRGAAERARVRWSTTRRRCAPEPRGAALRGSCGRRSACGPGSRALLALLGPAGPAERRQRPQERRAGSGGGLVPRRRRGRAPALPGGGRRPGRAGPAQQRHRGPARGRHHGIASSLVDVRSPRSPSASTGSASTNPTISTSQRSGFMPRASSRSRAARPSGAGWRGPRRRGRPGRPGGQHGGRVGGQVGVLDHERVHAGQPVEPGHDVLGLAGGIDDGPDRDRRPDRPASAPSSTRRRAAGRRRRRSSRVPPTTASCGGSIAVSTVVIRLLSGARTARSPRVAHCTRSVSRRRVAASERAARSVSTPGPTTTSTSPAPSELRAPPGAAGQRPGQRGVGAVARDVRGEGRAEQVGRGHPSAESRSLPRPRAGRRSHARGARRAAGRRRAGRWPRPEPASGEVGEVGELVGQLGHVRRLGVAISGPTGSRVTVARSSVRPAGPRRVGGTGSRHRRWRGGARRGTRDGGRAAPAGARAGPAASPRPRDPGPLRAAATAAASRWSRPIDLGRGAGSLAVRASTGPTSSSATESVVSASTASSAAPVSATGVSSTVVVFATASSAAAVLDDGGLVDHCSGGHGCDPVPNSAARGSSAGSSAGASRSHVRLVWRVGRGERRCSDHLAPPQPGGDRRCRPAGAAGTRCRGGREGARRGR